MLGLARLGMADGDVIGVIGDVTTPQRGDYGQGGKAPHGSQYYAMEDTGGFYRWGLSSTCSVHMHSRHVTVLSIVFVEKSMAKHALTTY